MRDTLYNMKHAFARRFLMSLVVFSIAITNFWIVTLVRVMRKLSFFLSFSRAVGSTDVAITIYRFKRMFLLSFGLCYRVNRRCYHTSIDAGHTIQHETPTRKVLPHISRHVPRSSCVVFFINITVFWIATCIMRKLSFLLSFFLCCRFNRCGYHNL